MIYDILESKIIAADLGEAGKTLFRQFLPSDVNIGIMTRIPLEGIPIDPHIPNYYKGKIQIITRHTDPVLGSKMANDVARILTVKSPEFYTANLERGDASISIFQPETLPIQFPRLESDGIEWSQHFKAAFTFQPL